MLASTRLVCPSQVAAHLRTANTTAAALGAAQQEIERLKQETEHVANVREQLTQQLALVSLRDERIEQLKAELGGKVVQCRQESEGRKTCEASLAEVTAKLEDQLRCS